MSCQFNATFSQSELLIHFPQINAYKLNRKRGENIHHISAQPEMPNAGRYSALSTDRVSCQFTTFIKQLPKKDI